MRSSQFPVIIKHTVMALATCVALGAAGLSQAQQPGPPPGQGHEQRGGEHGGDHRPDQRYEFRDADRDQLRRHYNSDFKHVDRNHRPDFHAGQPMPSAYRGKIKPMPQDVRRGMPPPPRGYQMGYYGGYAVVYDPVTFAVLQVMDILR
jgi:Ni/Co efflux regulator RcnB